MVNSIVLWKTMVKFQLLKFYHNYAEVLDNNNLRGIRINAFAIPPISAEISAELKSSADFCGTFCKFQLIQFRRKSGTGKPICMK